MNPHHQWLDDYTYAAGGSVPPLPKSTSFGGSGTGNGNGQKVRLRVPMEKRCVPLKFRLLPFFVTFGSFHRVRYYAKANGRKHWPPEIHEFNAKFTKTLERIKHRHDPTVTTVAQGVLEWKRSQNEANIGLDIQAWLDRFYLSRIGIRFLIGQRASSYFLLRYILLKLWCGTQTSP
jgi:pyruvate dehydrogenase kinase 2/3/4